MQMQHTQPLVAPAAAPNAFAPGNGMAMAPATANQVNNDGSGCPSNQSSLLFVQQVLSLSDLYCTLPCDLVATSNPQCVANSRLV